MGSLGVYAFIRCLGKRRWAEQEGLVESKHAHAFHFASQDGFEWQSVMLATMQSAKQPSLVFSCVPPGGNCTSNVDHLSRTAG